MSNYPELPEPEIKAGEMMNGRITFNENLYAESDVHKAIDTNRAMRWHSASEEPEHGQQCWVTLHWKESDESCAQAYAIWQDGDWYFDLQESGDLYSRQKAIKDGFTVAEVTAWMPLPQPPKA